MLRAVYVMIFHVYCSVRWFVGNSSLFLEFYYADGLRLQNYDFTVWFEELSRTCDGFCSSSLRMAVNLMFDVKRYTWPEETIVQTQALGTVSSVLLFSPRSK